MTDSGLDKAHWERVAEQWIAWARSPDHDAFWAYRENFKRFVGTGSGQALEVGCGEGRISRELKALGYHVTATDAVDAMVAAAAEADSAHEYHVTSADALPFDDGRFDLVMAYNMLMDVENVPAAVSEIRRVMKKDGTLFISLVHPFRDRGRFAGPQPDAAFVVEGSYYGRERFEAEESHGGLAMQFAGWSQPLEDYAAALEQAGLAIVALREPVPDEAVDRLERCRRIPLFLWLKVRALA